MNAPGSPDRLDYLYIAGSGHSGSTLLSFLVNAHPEVFDMDKFQARCLDVCDGISIYVRTHSANKKGIQQIHG